VDLAAASSLWSIGADGSGGGDGGGDGGAGGDGGDGGPLSNAKVTLTDANGRQVDGKTDANGKFLLKYNTQLFKAPMVLRIVDEGGNVLTSVVSEVAAPGKATWTQINPLTDKVVSDSLVSGVNRTDSNFTGAAINTAKLTAAKADLVTSVKDGLKTAGIANPCAFDPVTSTYAYDGKGVDTIIDSVGHTRDAATGATQLRVKLDGVKDNADGTVARTLVTAVTPLPVARVAIAAPDASGPLTFQKMKAWMDEVNRCLALGYLKNGPDVDCADADGSRLFSNKYLNAGRPLRDDLFQLFSNPDGTPIAGSRIYNPRLLYVGKYPFTTTGDDDLAVVEVSISQPKFGSRYTSFSNTSGAYRKILVFARNDNLYAKAGNWIALGDRGAYQISVEGLYRRYQQMNPLMNKNLAGGWPSNFQTSLVFYLYDRYYDEATGKSIRANLRAVRVSGPGLPKAGLVFVPSSTPGVSSFAIYNSTGQIPSSNVSTANSGNGFTLAAMTADGAPLSAGLLDPTSSATPMITDYSSLQAYSSYRFELFSNADTSTTPYTTIYRRNLSEIIPVKDLPKAQWNELNAAAPEPSSTALVTAPAPGASSLTVNWTNNWNAGPVYAAYVSAGTRAGSVAGIADVFATNTSRVKSANVYAPAGGVFAGTFPSLNLNTAGDYRWVYVDSLQGRGNFSNLMVWSSCDGNCP
jgi:hypothetical protein